MDKLGTVYKNITDSLTDWVKEKPRYALALIIVLAVLVIILAISLSAKSGCSPEGFSGAGLASLNGNDQDQATLKGSSSGRSEGFHMPSWAKNSYTVKQERFAPGVIQQDADGYYFVDNDNPSYGKIYLVGTPLSADGTVLTGFLIDNYGRSYYYSSEQGFSLSSSGVYVRDGSELAKIYITDPSMLVDIGKLPQSLTQAQLNQTRQRLGCNAKPVDSSWDWMKEGMTSGEDMDQKLMKSMKGQ